MSTCLAGDSGSVAFEFRHKADLLPKDAGYLFQSINGGVRCAGFYLLERLHTDTAMFGKLGLGQSADLSHGHHSLRNGQCASGDIGVGLLSPQSGYIVVPEKSPHPA